MADLRTPWTDSLGLRVGLATGGLALVLVSVAIRQADNPSVWWLLLPAVGVGLLVFAWVRVRLQRLDDMQRQLQALGDEKETLQRLSVAGTDEVARLSRVAASALKRVNAEMAELRRMETYRRDFIGDVSHELKTPIFAIRGFAETLEAGALEDPEVNRKFVGRIARNADRLDNLAKDLSEIARIEHGELKMVFEPFDAGKLGGEIVESLEPLATQQEVDLSLMLPEELPEVVGDREHLRQVLVNLLENAIKYNRKGGSVELRFVQDGPDQMRLQVWDDGIGIPEEMIPRITERFFRVDKSRSRVQGGTGLGLAIVKHILAAHDQTLTVSSEEGLWSRFEFSLPVAQADA